MAGETILGGTYGLEIQPKNDPYIRTAAEATRTLFTAAIPGTFLVDLVPVLKYVPDWMPFADFKRKAKQWRKLSSDMINLPYDAIRHNIVNFLFVTQNECLFYSKDHRKTGIPLRLSC
ncbi:hypothetical protein C0992_004971 [Termitomyces sp. T32_za158]|nr:hypothetical protein C0992_004971 [Termitomyces sp. T32_za158]